MKKRGFFNFKLFDGISDEIFTNRIIRVNNDRIVGIGDLAEKMKYSEYEWTDLNGCTLMPGLIDAHLHITVPFVFKINLDAILQMNAQLEKNFYNNVKYGVTTVRDVGAFPNKMRKWRQKINSGKAVGPRIMSSYSFITSPNGVPEMAPTLNFFEKLMAGGQFVERLSDPAKARFVANRLVDQGADWIKTQYSEESFLFHGKLGNLSDDCFMALRHTADERGVGMAMHHTESAGFQKGVQIGVNTLEHCATDPLDRKDIDSFVQKDMAIIPTLKVMGDGFEIEEMMSWLNHEGKSDFMPEPLRQSIYEIKKLFLLPYPPSDYMKKFYMDIEFFKKGYPVALNNVEKIKTAGGKIGVGTDTCGTGLGFFGFYYRELEHLISAGFSNSEALKAATSVNADIIGMGHEVGSIEKGKYADFTIIDGDPLNDIQAVRNIRQVIKGGETVIDHTGDA